MTRLINTATCFTVAIVLAVAGCGKSGDKTDSKTEPEKKGAHPSHGPHDGGLVELGDEEYHAEIINDEKTHTVTIYVLDGTAKKAVPIDAKEVLINLKHDGKPEQFKLPAVPDTGDPEGKSSRFQLKHKELVHDLGHDGAEPKLTVRIKGNSYTGDIKHVHGADEH